MPDYAGPLQRLVLSRTLWLVIVWPVAGFAWQVLVGRRSVGHARGSEATRRALASSRHAGLGCVALATASALAHAVVLASAPKGERELFEPLARGARLGQLATGINLLFDSLSATFCVLACLVALGVSVFLAARPFADPGWRGWAWVQLSLAGALIAFVSDGFVGVAVGWTISGAAAAWLAGWSNSEAGTAAFTRSAVAICALLLGGVLLFWGLGGAWDGDDYAADPLPRFVPVHVTGGPLGNVALQASGGSGDRSDSGSLTFADAPGAIVFIDDSRTPAGQSPFIGIPVRSGAHSLRIHSGDGSNDDVLARVAFEDGQEVALIPFGPTLAFRAIANQIALRDRTDDAPVRNALEARAGPGGAPVVVASFLAFLVAAAFVSAAARAAHARPEGEAPTIRPRGAPLPLAALARGGTTATLGPYLLLRVAFLLPMSPSVWIAIEALGAAILLAAGWRAPTSFGIGRWLAFVGAAPAGLAYLALGAAGVRAATYACVLSGAATAALYLAAAHLRRASEQAEVTAASFDDLLLVRAPELLGGLLVSMDRWVVGSTAASIATLARAGAWAAAAADDHVVALPGTLVAARLLRVARNVEPMVGMPLGRMAWALLGTVGLAATLHALWPS